MEILKYMVNKFFIEEYSSMKNSLTGEYSSMKNNEEYSLKKVMYL